MSSTVSPTKKFLRPEEITHIIQDAFGETTKVIDIQGLHDGMYNASYKVKFFQGSEYSKKQVVLKVSPPRDVDVMSHEKDIMKTEYTVNKILAKDSSVPVPSILYYDFDNRAIGSSIIIFEFLEGNPLHNIKKKIPPQQLASLRYNTGVYMNKIHQHRGDFFGYIARSSNIKGDTWFEAFSRMFRAILEDAEKKSLKLPIGKKKLESLLQKNERIFYEVREPVLNHFDMWDGNIFVKQEGDTFQIEAIIDNERAFYGDPLCDFVSSVTIFGDVLGEKAFLEGYYNTPIQAVSFSSSQMFRLHVYKLYLYLIMFVETAYRGYGSWFYKCYVKRKIRKTYRKAKKILL